MARVKWSGDGRIAAGLEENLRYFRFLFTNFIPAEETFVKNEKKNVKAVTFNNL